MELCSHDLRFHISYERTIFLNISVSLTIMIGNLLYIFLNFLNFNSKNFVKAKNTILFLL